MTSLDVSAELETALCEAFDVRQDEPDFWTVRSPFVFEDGDALPVFISHSDDTWRLTDRGMTVSHLFFDEFQFTEARFGRVSHLVGLHTAMIDEHNEISLALNGPPTPYDIGLFLQLVAQVQGIALVFRSDRDQSRYVTTVREHLSEQLVSADFESNWTPSGLAELTRATYRADLRIGSQDGSNVVLFAASTSDKANVSALTMGQFRKVDDNLIPVLAYRPDRVASEAIYRFQDEVGMANSVVEVEPGSYRALYGWLQRHGVEVQSPS